VGDGRKNLSPMRYHYSHCCCTYSVERGLSLVFKLLEPSTLRLSVVVRLVPRTASVGKFDWGGTSVKW
jgi:hypothetical protein